MLHLHNSAICSCYINPLHSIIYEERKGIVAAVVVSENVYRVSDSQGIVFVTMELCCCSRALELGFVRGGLVGKPV